MTNLHLTMYTPGLKDQQETDFPHHRGVETVWGSTRPSGKTRVHIQLRTGKIQVPQVLCNMPSPHFALPASAKLFFYRGQPDIFEASCPRRAQGKIVAADGSDLLHHRLPPLPETHRSPLIGRGNLPRITAVAVLLEASYFEPDFCAHSLSRRRLRARTWLRICIWWKEWSWRFVRSGMNGIYTIFYHPVKVVSVVLAR